MDTGQGSPGPGSSGSDPDTGGDDGPLDPDGSTTSGDETGPETSTSDEEGPRFDVAEGDGSPGDGCEKIDFLFVVDNSGSMTVKQQNLVDTFPGFVATIRNRVQGQDHHIMVVDSDGPLTGSCDERAGAGRTSAGATLLTGEAACSMPGPERYTNEADPALEATFACIATVGIYGESYERPMEGMTQALAPDQIQPGGCNAGFLRDDAVLVVTVITDTDDGVTGKSPGGPATWRQALVDAKQGNEDAIVALGVIGDNDLPGALCLMGGGGDPALHAEPPYKIRELIDSFGEHGLSGSVCAADYAPFFEQAVERIDAACDEFDPEG